MSIAMGKRFTRGLSMVALVFDRGMQNPFFAHFLA